MRYVGTLTVALLSAMHFCVAHAAPGYEYELIYTSGQFPGQALGVQFPGRVAINNRGDIVFSTEEKLGFSPAIYRVFYVPKGQAPVMIAESNMALSPNPRIDPARMIGLNNNGIVSVPLNWTLFDGEGNQTGVDVGYGLFNPAIGLIREIRNLQRSSGTVNNALQMAGRLTFPSRLVVTDGLSSNETVLGLTPNNGETQINERGTAATATTTAADQTAITWGTPPGPLQTVAIGDRLGLGYNSSPITPGMNDRGRGMSFVTDNDLNNLNPNPRVLLISVKGSTQVVAQTSDSDFVNFRQPRGFVINKGVPVNSANRVSFTANTADAAEGFWIGNASGDEPTLVYERSETITFTDGRTFDAIGFVNDVTHHGANSLNDDGEITIIASGTLRDVSGTPSNTVALFIARPVIDGLEPGRPVRPRAIDRLSGGGFRFFWRRPIVRIGALRIPRFPRIYYDPPMAVGYDYTVEPGFSGAFTSVLIPTPLPEGDEDFLVEFNGVSAPLQAGTAFTFADVSPDPVQQFRISGIDESEMLDPEDPVAFVTGLTFSDDAEQDLSFTMVPVVFNPDASDADGDGVDDADDNCPAVPNPGQTDNDNDGLGDPCDEDDDNDLLADSSDNCPLVANVDQSDVDEDGAGDACDGDLDGDGIANEVDNCPAAANLDQTDTDGDNLGDECDGNDDNDAWDDVVDNCPSVFQIDQTDLDADGIGDSCDSDVDGDSVSNAGDNCPIDVNASQDDTDFDGTGDACDADDDSDGVEDEIDNCPLVSNADQSDLDGNGVGDACDDDSDGDGIANAIDNCPFDANSAQLDTDGDGAGDACDADIDGDSVVNALDICEGTALGEATDASGCSITQLCPCEGPRGMTVEWKNHGKFVSCIARAGNRFLEAGLVSDEQRADIMSDSGQSTCGVR